jgi:hypothetical protein
LRYNCPTVERLIHPSLFNLVVVRGSIPAEYSM